VLKGEYPSFLPGWIWRWLSGKVIQPGDLQTIAAPIDFLGINYYRRTVMRYAPLVQSVPVFPKDYEYTDMGWEIYALGLYDLLLRLKRDYAVPQLFISENGAAVRDELSDGSIHDARRIQYLREHLVQTQRAIQDGVPVRGYMVWSLLDNFEWALGYDKRFGLIHVDYETQARIPKLSARWFGEVARQNRVV